MRGTDGVQLPEWARAGERPDSSDPARSMLAALWSITSAYAVTSGILILGGLGTKLAPGDLEADAPSAVSLFAVNAVYGTMVIVFGGFIAALIALRKVVGLLMAVMAIPAFISLFAVATDALRLGPELWWVYGLTLLVPIARLTGHFLDMLRRRA